MLRWSRELVLLGAVRMGGMVVGPVPLPCLRWWKLVYFYLLFHVLVKGSAAPCGQERLTGSEHVPVDAAVSVLSWDPQKGLFIYYFLCCFMHQRKEAVQTGS